ncbi:MAG: histidine--tRNA ligase [Candidatus Magasanikbacteria bacterium CG_4_10_14_0_8_um_filter_32_14]|uniref:Histidine--tRNA ligase n=2 Tax=Candidatus Magasanikiibacteriota TaxID=1752731 RepID=A0A2M7RAS1_9BACT|nr:MAG: histidine--tRNA ligase [Candidatus Magasanikbacteria bacterium CG_4_10_14_0_8_um_filter_32_14]
MPKKISPKAVKKTLKDSKKTTIKKVNSKKKVVSKVVNKFIIENKKEKKITYNTLRGMRDILPRNGEIWQRVYEVVKNVSTSYGFSYVETPILEQAGLFIRSIGRGTDVIDKEMYVFEDKDGEKVCLRPEMTASLARSYIENGMQNMPQPVKMWYHGQMFRHDRPQAGRFRQFYQFGCETIGDSGPVTDAELISVAYNTLKDLGIETVVHINSIGTLQDRENYIVELVSYLRSKRSYLSEESKKRINKNPLRILDSKDEQDIAVIEEAPQIIDWLSPESKKFFTTVLEYLDEIEIPYVLNPTLVRGLDYYTNTVFEFFCDDEEMVNIALGGGGRYDSLIEQLGGQPTPAAGFALGLDRIVLIIKNKQDMLERAGLLGLEKIKKNKIFFAQLGEKANKKALYILELLRREGLFVYHNFSKSSLKAQMEIADKIGSTHTLILGQKEVQDDSILVRNMDSGIQEVVDQKKICNFVRKLLQN